MHISKIEAPSAKHYYRKNFAGALVYAGLIGLIFAQYLTTAVPAYLLMMIGLLLRRGVKLPSRIVLYLCAVTLYWVAVMSYATGKNVFTHMLFYFGFLLPLIVFASDRRISISFFVNEKTLIGLCLLTLLEAVLFNSPVAHLLYFFPPEGSNDRIVIFGFYQRPMGIGGNPSLTAAILFFFAVLNDRIHGVTKLATQALIVVTTLALASGTGFGLLLVYLLVLAFRSIRYNIKGIALGVFYLSILLAALALALGFIVDLWSLRLQENFDKFSIGYFVLMYNYKMLVAASLFDGIDIEAILFGRQIISSAATTTGDAGMLNAVSALGLVGTMLLFAAPFLYVRGIWRNIVPTMFFFLSFVHYMGLLTPPGQVLLACYVWWLVQSGYGAGKSERVISKDNVLVGRA